MEATRTAPHRSRWIERLTLLIPVALLWAGLGYLTNGGVFSNGMDRPVLALLGPGGAINAIGVLALLLAGALLGELLGSRRDGASGLLVVALGVAFWAYAGGTMDDWLIARNPIPGPATGAAYRPLIGEYLFWAVAVAGTMFISAWRNRSSGSNGLSGAWRRLYGPHSSAAGTRDGVTALIVTTVVAGVLIMILSGPRVAHTRHGQEYFAVAAAFVLGVIISERITGVRSMIWYLSTPLIVGIGGLLIAMSRPGLPGVYQNINVIPASGLVRPLPVEMVGVGLAAIILTLRTLSRISSETDRS